MDIERDGGWTRIENNRKAFIVIAFAYNKIWSASPVGATKDNITQHITQQYYNYLKTVQIALKIYILRVQQSLAV